MACKSSEVGINGRIVLQIKKIIIPFGKSKKLTFSVTDSDILLL